MSAIFFLIIYFSSILSLGYLLLSLIVKDKKQSLSNILSLSLLLGMGSISILFFWLALLNLPPSRLIISAIFAISSIVLLYLWYRKKLVINQQLYNLFIACKTTSNHNKNHLEDKRAKNKQFQSYLKIEEIIGVLSLLIFIFLFVIIYIQAMKLPLYDVDAFGLWGLKAKAIYAEGLSENGLFFQLPLSYSHLNYPLLVPFLSSGVYAAIGEANDIMGKIIFPFLFIAGSIFIYNALQWKLSKIWAVLLTLMFISMPAFIRWNSAGIADVPLTIFYACSVFYLVKYIMENRKEDLILAILMTVFCGFIKNEGIAIVGINIAIFALFNTFPFSFKKFKITLIFIFSVTLLLLPWFLWSRNIPHTHENYPLRIQYIFSTENLNRIKEILTLFGYNFINIYRWGLLWIFLPILTFISIFRTKYSKDDSSLLKAKKKKFLNTIFLNQKHIVIMWGLLIAQVLAYIFVFIISPWTPQFLAEMALERILLHCAPAALFLISFYISDLRF